MILKRDYEKQERAGRRREVQRGGTDGTDETHRYAFANLRTDRRRTGSAARRLKSAKRTYTLAKDRTYYTDEGGIGIPTSSRRMSSAADYAFAENDDSGGLYRNRGFAVRRHAVAHGGRSGADGTKTALPRRRIPPTSRTAIRIWIRPFRRSTARPAESWATCKTRRRTEAGRR